jgi:hypothetical protein
LHHSLRQEPLNIRIAEYNFNQYLNQEPEEKMATKMIIGVILIISMTLILNSCTLGEAKNGKRGTGEQCTSNGFECGDCVDNDGDGKIDYSVTKNGKVNGDPDCESLIDNAEGVCIPSVEICQDGIDNDCIGGDALCACIDTDSDGFYLYNQDACPSGNDCEDNDKSVHPGAAEICQDGLDNDCSGGDAICNCTDNDGDGFYFYDKIFCPSGNDCNDDQKSVHPGAAEICQDGLDNDCSGGDTLCNSGSGGGGSGGTTITDCSDDPDLNQSCDGDDADSCEEGIYECQNGVLVCSDNTDDHCGGVLLFESGFEPDTYVLDDEIKGIDNNATTGINDWGNLSGYLPWVLYGDAYFEGGSMEISEDPFDSENHVLHLHNTENVSDYSRSQWELEQVHNWYVEGDPNLFEQQFYRFRILIPERITTLYSTEERAGWYMIWESHAWDFEPTRHGIYLFKLEDSDHWGFRIVQQSSITSEYLYENEDYYDVEVPIDEWFTMEIFFKYDEIDGEFYVAIQRDGQPRQTIANYTGQTKYGTKLHDQMMFKLYHHSDYLNRTTALGLDGIHQYYDDFEIWSDYPPDYW